MHALLTQGKVGSEIKRVCGTKIFSGKYLTSFIEYLDDLESNISDEHKQIVEKKYGKYSQDNPFK